MGERGLLSWKGAKLELPMSGPQGLRDRLVAHLQGSPQNEAVGLRGSDLTWKRTECPRGPFREARGSRHGHVLEDSGSVDIAETFLWGEFSTHSHALGPPCGG